MRTILMKLKLQNGRSYGVNKMPYNVMQGLCNAELSTTTKIDLKTELNINREPRHIAYVLL